MSKVETVVNFLRRVRSPIADYQEPDFPKTEQYSFTELMKALCQHAYAAVITIVTMLYNLLPLFDGFTYLARFVLDKLIDILETPDVSDKVVKSLIFVGELIILIFLVYFITTLLLLPIIHFIFIFVYKVFHASTSIK